jgi:hypothetical protein
MQFDQLGTNLSPIYLVLAQLQPTLRGVQSLIQRESLRTEEPPIRLGLFLVRSDLAPVHPDLARLQSTLRGWEYRIPNTKYREQ